MKAVVVYESLWGNTAAIAGAIAEGIGPEARALPADQADPSSLAGADLVVAAAPLLGFKLPTESMRDGIRKNPGRPPAPPDLSHPSLRSWLEKLPQGSCRYAAFETRLRLSPGSATGEIAEAFERAGYRPATDAKRFIVKGKFGPLKDGELEKARAWGAELAQAAGSPEAG
jgi:hypothetical protein